jgi:HNH endonuclease
MPTVEQYAGAAGRVLLRLEETPGPLETPCWIWPGARSGGNGYGYVRIGGKGGGKIVPVHALVFRVLTGRAPRRDQHVHHRCEVPLCANPDHLEAVTRRQHGQRHRRALASCGHPHDMVMGRRKKSRRCRACRNAARREQYRKARA